MTTRIAEHPISEAILNRWSPRAYDTKEVPEEILHRVFEAARWAPSANNKQPWRYLVANTPEQLEIFHSFILEGNLAWAHKAPVLTLLISQNDYGMNSFDAGTSWGFLALQATKEGLITHPMGGIDREKAREVLNISAEYDIHLAIAIGYQGDAAELPERFQEREVPSTRKPLEEVLIHGSFK